MQVRGSCLCGSVRFAVTLPGILINNCHCSRCRKASGAAFGSYFHCSRESFAWLAGADAITHYRPPVGDPRPFCPVCGSRVPLVEAEGVIIPAGLLDEDPGVAPCVNIHAASKAPWYPIADGLPTFDEDAPASFWARFE